MLLRPRPQCLMMQAPRRCLAPTAAPLHSLRPCFQGQRLQAPAAQGASTPGL